MNQKFNVVLCDGAKFNRIRPEDYGIQGELISHAVIGNPFTNVVLYNIFKRPLRVCWMGELAGTEGIADSTLPYDEIMEYYNMAWEGSPLCGTLPHLHKADILNDQMINIYLVNHTRMQYIDMDKYIFLNQKHGKCLDPLPFLTACGYGCGDDDCKLANGNEFIGTWAFHHLEYTDSRPDSRFQEVEVQFESVPHINPLTNKIVVVTGKIPRYTRTEVQDFINRAGGLVQSNVNRSTGILVVGIRPGKTKLEAADIYRTSIMSSKEFRDIIAQL